MDPGNILDATHDCLKHLMTVLYTSWLSYSPHDCLEHLKQLHVSGSPILSSGPAVCFQDFQTLVKPQNQNPKPYTIFFEGFGVYGFVV